ncbi:hypothetical protein V8B55DRAFT_1160282 [Mucor lusitanicus]|uniref:Late endosomal/lysosomal adaptor and MAPK and MTOR activator 1 n=1 Tax=Mucor lusitanicus CBS 277.49 TaxID=747725 RepID=A0A168NMG0_MUCCL|nr:hypothetical protein MUCCIDRAFT_155331 [Mucor lusitanicus CBS 277.49]
MGCCLSRDTHSDYNQPIHAKTPLLDADELKKQEEQTWKSIIENASNMMINTTSSNGNYTLLPQEVEQRTRKYKSILRKSKVAPLSYSNQILCNYTTKMKPVNVLADAQPYGGLSVENLLWIDASLCDIRLAKKRLSTSLKLENTSSILISMKRITPLANKKANTNRQSFAAA